MSGGGLLSYRKEDGARYRWEDESVGRRRFLGIYGRIDAWEGGLGYEEEDGGVGWRLEV